MTWNTPMSELGLGRWMERTERRLSAIEAIIETLKTYARRVGIIVAVWGLTALAASFPDTKVAQLADAIRPALMRH